MRLKWILLLTVAVTSVAEARPRRVNTVVSAPQVVYSPATPVFAPAPMPVVTTAPVSVPPAAVPVVSGGVAQSKAETQARSGQCFHPGGSLGGGTHEGCGFSTVSADDAVRHCCYWGQRTPIDVGVVRGANGWYATVLYR